MAKFHPEIDLLTEYSAGSLPLAQAACVSAHLNYCTQCGRTVEQLEGVGAALFDGLDAEPVGDTLLNSVLARLDDSPPLRHAKPENVESARTPGILQRLMKGGYKAFKSRFGFGPKDGMPAWNKITKEQARAKRLKKNGAKGSAQIAVIWLSALV